MISGMDYRTNIFLVIIVLTDYSALRKLATYPQMVKISNKPRLACLPTDIIVKSLGDDFSLFRYCYSP